MTKPDWPLEQPTLEGNGVRLRPWRVSDTDEVTEACQDPAIQRWTTVPVPYQRSHAEGFVGTLAPEQWAARTGALFCIAASHDDRVIGSCGLVDIGREDMVAEVGYWVAPAARAAGVATRALERLSAWGLEDGGMSRLEFYVAAGNLESCAVAERLGCMRLDVPGHGAFSTRNRTDVVLYTLVR